MCLVVHFLHFKQVVSSVFLVKPDGFELIWIGISTDLHANGFKSRGFTLILVNV